MRDWFCVDGAKKQENIIIITLYNGCRHPPLRWQCAKPPSIAPTLRILCSKILSCMASPTGGKDSNQLIN